MNNHFSKFISLFLLLSLHFNCACFAVENISPKQEFDYALSVSKDLYQNGQNDIIEDFLAKENLNGFAELKYHEITPIRDSLIDKEFIKKHSKNTAVKREKSCLHDDLAEHFLESVDEIPYQKKIYDFENINNIKIKIKSKKYITTKNLNSEGQKIEFVVAEDVVLNDKILIPKNSIIQARVETISPNMSRGIPADLIIGHFKYNKQELDGEISKTGANRFYWTMPMAFVANTFLFGSGYILWAIRGGHAKLKPNQVYEISLPEMFANKSL